MEQTVDPARGRTDLLDDELLVQRARDGGEEAFEILARRHQDRAFAVALRLSGNRHDAEDITQEALVAAWRALPRFRAESTFSTWLYRIVTNTAHNHTRHRTDLPAQTLPQGSAAPGADLQAESNERLDAIGRAIVGLPFEQRAALVLRTFQGCSYEEVADILGISVPAVKSRLHRARRDLASTLAAGS